MKGGNPVREETGTYTTMPEENYQHQIRCQFNAYCKKAIANRAKELKRNSSRRWKNERFFEELSAYDQERILMERDPTKKNSTLYSVKGRIISKSQIHEAIRSLPESKHIVVLLYYFDELNDNEIGKALSLPRRVANYRRNSALAAIEEYLEDHRK